MGQPQPLPCSISALSISTHAAWPISENHPWKKIKMPHIRSVDRGVLTMVCVLLTYHLLHFMGWYHMVNCIKNKDFKIAKSFQYYVITWVLTVKTFIHSEFSWLSFDNEVTLKVNYVFLFYKRQLFQMCWFFFLVWEVAIWY